MLVHLLIEGAFVMKKLWSAFLAGCLLLSTVPASAASVEEVRLIIEKKYVDPLSPA